MELQFTNIEG